MLVFLLLAGLFAEPHSVTAKPASTVFTLKPAMAHVIEENGTILTCDSGYGLYIQPLDPKKPANFYQVIPPQTFRMTPQDRYIVTCLLVK